jgi:hypothetical protein
MRHWMLALVAVALGVAYAVFFTDWFRHPSFEIVAQVRPSMPSDRAAKRNNLGTLPQSEASMPVSFAFSDKFRINEIKVIEADDSRTNATPQVMWHLISDSASEPTKALIYGQRVKGMKPILPHAQAQPLQPDVTYQMLVQAGRYHGEVNFKTRERAAAVQK